MVNLVLDDKWLFGVEAEAGECGEWGSLIKHVEVADGELLVYRLRHFECCLFFFAYLVTLTELNGARSCFALNCKLYEIG